VVFFDEYRNQREQRQKIKTHADRFSDRTLTIIERTLDLYRRKGLDTVLKVGWKRALTGRSGRFFRSILGELLHQKLLMYPWLGYWPQIREPRTFNEKLLHRKLYTDDERFARIEDKWTVREYVSERVGSDVLPEIYCVTDDPWSIDFESLPSEYVVKPNHLSGPVIFVSEDDQVDTERVRWEVNEWLDQIHGTITGEYWYSQIDPQILIEERLYGQNSSIPRDFKFFVFHGRVEYVEVDSDRHSNHTRRFYDRDWNPQDFSLKYPLGPETDQPDRFDEMLMIAEDLGSDFDFMRVDLYLTDDSEIMFGEMTVTPEGGRGRFRPVEYDFEFGNNW